MLIGDLFFQLENIQPVLFLILSLPPALAGGIKLEWFLLALAKIAYFLARANARLLHIPPAKAGGN